MATSQRKMSVTAPKINQATHKRMSVPVTLSETAPVGLSSLAQAVEDPRQMSPAAVLTLQRAYGNRAVQRLMDRSTVWRKPFKDGELDPSVSEAIQCSRGGGLPLADSIRSPMEQSFRTELSGVRVHADAQADRLNRSVSAKAFAIGSDIYFRGGNYNPGHSSGRQLIAHELTHVIQQGGGKSNQIQGKLALGPIGDRYEQEADRVAAQIGKTSGPIEASAPRRLQPRIQRWAALGPWGPGWEKGAAGSAPVHETMTTMAMRNAKFGGVGKKTTFHDTPAWETAGRGATWNDDPEGMLHDTTSLGFGLGKKSTQKYSTGIQFGLTFKGAEKRALRGEQIGPQDRMLARSHFGDLQFLHGMAVRGEEAAKTQANMLMWAEFTYRVGRGEISIKTLIKDAANVLTGEHKGMFAALFPPDIPVAQLTIEQFFGVKDGGPGDAKARAIGSLLHMVEDTYAESHTEREELEGGKVGRIISFHAFAGQDEALHHQADLPSGEGKTTEERILATPRAMQAVDAATRVLTMLKKSPWTTQVIAMFEDILGLVKRAKPAGPGAKFVADTLPTLSQFKESTNAGRLARRASDSRLVLIDNKLGAYDAIRKDISKDKQKRTLIASMYRDVNVWLKQARGDDPTKLKRKPGVQDFRNKLHTHRLFPDYLK